MTGSRGPDAHPVCSYVTWLAVFSTALTTPTFQHFLTLFCGTVLAAGPRTVTAALRVLGQQTGNFGKFHRVFNRARWSPMLLSRLLLRALVARFLAPEAPALLLVDETLERRRARQLAFRGLFRDGVRSTAEGVQFTWGVRWLCLALLVPVPWSRRPWAFTFRASREELLTLDRRHLILGLVWTWLVGIGRWWDDPGARLLQHLGLGSVIYVFALALLLWLTAWPLRPRSWSYFRVLTFVSLCSPPAALYAIPVERWFGFETATWLNVLFLAVVAAWRVALYKTFLSIVGQLRFGAVAVGTTLPIMGVIVALTFLNLERVVFQLMGGLRDPNAAAGAYLILIVFTGISFYGSFILVPWYLVEVGGAWSRARKARTTASATSRPPEQHPPA